MFGVRQLLRSVGDSTGMLKQVYRDSLQRRRTYLPQLYCLQIHASVLKIRYGRLVNDLEQEDDE